jgi:hypothetical protein
MTGPLVSFPPCLPKLPQARPYLPGHLFPHTNHIYSYAHGVRQLSSVSPFYVSLYTHSSAQLAPRYDLGWLPEHVAGMADVTVVLYRSIAEILPSRMRVVLARILAVGVDKQGMT